MKATAAYPVNRERTIKTRVTVSTAMLAAVAYALAFMEITALLSPSFARFDLSDLPSLVGAFYSAPERTAVQYPERPCNQRGDNDYL